ncbi:MAG: PEP-CTERM sorting domain-containing protein [Crocosphaera sp.]|nr:PEP-CTERM sorting domain-containing protein [Crocosphaera sp.]
MSISKNLISSSVLYLISTGISFFGEIPSASAITFYDDRADWEEAVNPNTITTETFPDSIRNNVSIEFESGIISTREDSEDITLGNKNRVVNLSWGARRMGHLGSEGYFYNGQLHNPDSEQTYSTANFADYITWHFPNPIKAFFSVFGSVQESVVITLNFDDFTTYEIDLTNEDDGPFNQIDDGLFGWVSDKTFSSMTFTNPYGSYEQEWAMDNIALATDTAATPDTNAVPEPLTMLGAGTAIAFGTTFKRKLGQTKKKPPVNFPHL